MPGQKRKAEDSLGESVPAKRARGDHKDYQRIDRLFLDYGDSTEKSYDTVHFKSSPLYITPSNSKDNEVGESGASRSRRPKRVHKVADDPLHMMGDGSQVLFDTGFILQRDGDEYTCTCPVFKGKAVDRTKTTCVHLQEYLGYGFETRRVAKKNDNTPRSHTSVNVLLAQKFEDGGDLDPKGWWLSEKLDGVRGFWNGQYFYSRLGNIFRAPTWFTKDLPRDMTLDGELFGGRGQFQDTVRKVKSGPDADWSNIRFHIFDCPSLASRPFEERMEAILAMFKRKRPGHAVFVTQTKCKGLTHLNEVCDRVLFLGGEGMMLRQPKSLYEGVRSSTLLKMKKFYDAEAVVIDHEPGKGKNTSACGALRCRMECGMEFSVGSGLTNKDRRNPPAIGSIVTYKFQELTNSGKPRFPSYLGVRIDMDSPKDAVLREVVED